MILQNDTTVPGLNEARAMQAQVTRLGIRDVEFMYDGPLKMWMVCQLKKSAHGIVVLENFADDAREPWLLWYCKNDQGSYRPPSEKDVNDIIATVHRAEKWMAPGGGDALADELEIQESTKKVNKEEQLKERLGPYIRPLKKAIRNEIG